MFDSDLLVVWMPNRVHPRTVLDQAQKFGLSISEGCGEPEARARWLSEPGLVFSVVGWRGAWSDGRMTPPADVRAFLETVAEAEPAGFEIAFWRDPARLETCKTVLGLGHADFEGGVAIRVLPA